MSIVRPTPEQAAAADPRTSVWVTANAGTGKTRVLSDRVLRLLLNGAPPESLLCITFTKAAAVEMNERVERALAAWAVETDDDVLRTRLEATTGERPTAKTMRHARRLFARILELPRGLAIMTIHSFCQTILRRFPIEAGVPPHFEVVDDRGAAELMAEARSGVLLRAAHEPALSEALARLSAELADSSIDRLMDEALAKRGRLRDALGAHGDEAGLLDALARALDVDPQDDPQRLDAAFCVVDPAREFDLHTAADLLVADGGKSNVQCGTTIKAWLDEAAGRLEGLPVYRTAFLTKDNRPLAKVPTEKWRAANPNVFAAVEREAARLTGLEGRKLALAAFKRTEAGLRLANALLDSYRELKARETALDFDDLIERAADLLADDARRDWVLYKLDARLEHLLIDEAQDTSPAQWRIVEALVEEFLAGEGAHPHPRTFFVVGDEKQSIYSFQGADLAHFRAVRDRLRERAEAGGHKLAMRELALSFRSSAAVLAAVDACIALPELCPGVVDGGAVTHDSFRRNHPGLVELWPLVDPPETGETVEPWALPGQGQIRQSGQERTARAIAHAVKGWLDGGEVLAATGRPIRASDILILLSRRGRVQELVIRNLKRLGVPVAGADRLDLTGHIAVRDLMALGGAMLLPDDDLNMACLLKSPLIGLDEEALFTVCYGRGRTDRVFERLRDAAEAHGEPYATAHGLLDDWRERADFAPPYEFFARILAEGGRKRLVARLGPDALEPIEAFLSQALAYEQGHPASLQGFLHWLGLEDQKLKRDPEPARSEVRVMTVHGSKGLEAPVVILADAGPQRQNSTERLVFADGLPCWRGRGGERPPLVEEACTANDARLAEERMRLLYVALTRAKDRLHVVGWKHKSKPKEGEDKPAACWHDLIARALEACGDCERAALDLPFLRGAEAVRLRRGAAGAAAVPAAGTPGRPVPPLPPWLGPVRKEPPVLVRMAPSALDEDEPPADAARPGGGGDARPFGVALHRLLHLLGGIDPAEREGALERGLRALGRFDDEASFLELRRQVTAVLDLPDLAPAFAPGSRGEQPVIGRIGDVLISGQIDRLAVTEDAVYLVDFKSGRRPPDAVEATPVPYLRQLATYAVLLGRIYPGREVRAGLVWTVVPRLVPVPRHLLDAHLPPAARGARAP